MSRKIFILVTCGAIKLDEEQSKRLSSGLLQLLLSDKTASLSLQCIKSLLQQNGVHVDFILKNLITDLVGVATGIDPVVDISTKLSFEILILYTKNVVDNKQKLEAIYSLLLPLLIKRGTDDKLYTRDKLLHLIRQDALVFKEVVNKCLTPSQKTMAEELLKVKGETSLDIETDPQIELKTFG